MILYTLAPQAERPLAALVHAVIEEIIRLEEDGTTDRDDMRAERWRRVLREALPVLEALGLAVVVPGRPRPTEHNG
jgi:hypothetical protein